MNTNYNQIYINELYNQNKKDSINKQSELILLDSIVLLFKKTTFNLSQKPFETLATFILSINSSNDIDNLKPIKQAEAENAELKRKLEDAEAETTKIIAEAEAAEAENAELKIKLEDAEAETTKKIAEKEAENAELKGKLESAAKEAKEAQEQLEAAEAKTNDHNTNIITILENKKTYVRNLMNLLNIINDKQSEFEPEFNGINTDFKNIKTIGEEYDKLDSRVNQLKENVENKLKKTLKEIKEEKQTLINELNIITKGMYKSVLIHYIKKVIENMNTQNNIIRLVFGNGLSIPLLLNEDIIQILKNNHSYDTNKKLTSNQINNIKNIYTLLINDHIYSYEIEKDTQVPFALGDNVLDYEKSFCSWFETKCT